MAKNSKAIGACGACTCGRCGAKPPKSVKKAVEPALGSRRSSRKATQQLSTPGSMDAGASTAKTKLAVQLVMRRAVEEAVAELLLDRKLNRAAVARKHGVPISQEANFRREIKQRHACPRYCAYVRSTQHYKASVQPSAVPTLNPSKGAAISKAKLARDAARVSAMPYVRRKVRQGRHN